MSQVYALASNDLFTGDDTEFLRLLRDGGDIDDLEIESLAASGDCFGLLADQLDHLSLALEKNSAERFDAQRLVEILQYLQEHHRIIRKFD